MKAPTKGPRRPSGDADTPRDVHDTLRRGELVFPPEEAETLTAHNTRTLEEKFLESDVAVTEAGLAAKSRARVVAAPPVSTSAPPHTEPEPRRRDTMPVPPSGSGIPLAIPPNPAIGAPRPTSGSRPAAAEIPEAVGSADVLDDDSEDGFAIGGGGRPRRDEDTQTRLEVRGPQIEEDPPTSPTLSLAHQSDAAREVYRLFLASKYAPALAMATQLIESGDDDPMLVTIARECRLSVQQGGPLAEPWDEPQRSAALAEFPEAVSIRNLDVNADTTLGEMAALAGVTLEELLAVLDRFVALGVLPQRPPS